MAPEPGRVVLDEWFGDVQAVGVVGRGGITAAASTDVHHGSDGWVLDRIAVVAGDPFGLPDHDDVLERHRLARGVGVDRLLDEQVAAWRRRWCDASIEVGGDADVERGVRFGLFHLLSSAAGGGEAAVGARGLTGPGYAGHVFWDADVFVLPTLAATHPDAARAMLRYRLARMGAARARATAEGRDGLRFPWESAADGVDVTPSEVRLPGGGVMAVLTGSQEEHVVADVAWAAWHHACWTGDDDALTGRGGPGGELADLVLGCARYWASMVELDPDGSAHVRGVIGPDEYHETVDDNAYTNVMARWCLRLGARLLAGRDAAPATIHRWHGLATALVDGHRPDEGHHEQFRGYDRLEPLLARDVATPPFAADVLLGRDRVRRSQLRAPHHGSVRLQRSAVGTRYVAEGARP